jgi:hypothetical protein
MAADPTRRRQGRYAVAEAAVLATGVILFASGCGAGGDNDFTHSAVCVDRTTNTRMDDKSCSNLPNTTAAAAPTSKAKSANGVVAPVAPAPVGPGTFGWFYVPVGQDAPPVGSKVSPKAGSFTSPSGGSTSVQKGGVPAKGGTVSRGGLGVAGGGSKGGSSGS